MEEKVELRNKLLHLWSNISERVSKQIKKNSLFNKWHGCITLYTENHRTVYTKQVNFACNHMSIELFKFSFKNITLSITMAFKLVTAKNMLGTISK